MGAMGEDTYYIFLQTVGVHSILASSLLLV